MRYVAAYLLANLSGNATPDVAAISTILGSVGIDCDKTKAQKVIDACKGKSVEEVIAQGTKKLSSLPAAGAAAPAGGAAAPAAAAGDAKKGAAKEEPKKEEKKKDDSDEEGDDMVRRTTGLDDVRSTSALRYCRASDCSIKSQAKRTKSSVNFYQANSQQHHSYTLRLFLLMCVFCIDLF